MSRYTGYNQRGFANSTVAVTRAARGGTTPIDFANKEVTTLYLPFNDDIQDDSSSSQTITNRGSMTVDSTYTKFGSNALKSQSSGSLKIDNSSTMDLDTAFTVQFFLRTTDSLSNVALYTHNEINSSYSGLLFWIASDNTLRAYAANGSSGWNIFQNPSLLSNGSIDYSNWHHVAITYDGSTYRGYWDGSRKFEVTSSKLLPTGGSSYILSRNNSGSYTAGTGKVYIDDFRITKGVALYTDSSYTVPTSALGLHNGSEVSLYLPFDSDVNDDSPHGHTVTAYSDAAISSTQAKFGGNSLALDGSNDYLTVADHNNLEFGDDDFTIEFWFWTSNNSIQAPIGKRNNSWVNGDWQFFFNRQATGEVEFWSRDYSSSGPLINVIADSSGFGDSQWHHCVLTRSADQFLFFLDGDLKQTVTSSHSITNNSSLINIGRDYYAGGRYWWGGGSTGYIDDLRITKGVARYTKNFIPPSQAVGATLTGEDKTNTTTDFTTLYLPFDSDIQDDSAKGHSMTAIGDAAISSTQSKFGGYSLATDGTGDRLEFTYDTNSYFGTGDFTVEAWVWITGYSGGYYTVVSLGQPGATVSYQPKFLLNVESSGSKVRSIIGGTYIDHSDANL